MEIDNLLELYLKAKKNKKGAISHQRYEEAASARDTERKHSVVLYELLSGDKVEAFDYNNFEQLEKIVYKKDIGIIKMEVSRNSLPENFFLEKIPQCVIDSHAHRWLYSEVTSSLSSKFQMVLADRNIFLAGDYFGHNGLKSAVDSSENLIKIFKK